MARVIVLVCLLLFCFGAQKRNQASAIPILLPLTAVDFVLNVKENIDKIKEIFGSEKSQADQMKPVEAEMLNKLDGIVSNIENLRSDLTLQIAHIPTKFDTYITKLFDGINKVQSMYNTFMDLVANIKKYNPETLKEFVKEALSSSVSELAAVTKDMHTSLISPAGLSGDTILSILAGRNRENVQIMCGRNQSSQQIINDLYNTVVFTDMKSVSIRLFAYDQKAIYEKSPYEFEKEKLIEGFENRTRDTYKRVKNAMTTASRDIWRCNPETYEEDVSYSKLQEVLQKVLVFERDIKPKCYDQCYDYKEATTSCTSGFCQNEKKKCINGKLRDCEMLSDHIEYCYSAPNSSRQFEWLKTDNGRMLGHGSTYCQYKKAEKAHEWGDPSVLTNEVVNFWEKIKIGMHRCSYCLCTCEDNDALLDRYFSLNEVIADKGDNKVVTGIRFVKKNHVFYIQIKQGKLGVNGTIDSDEWKKVEEVQQRKDDMFNNPHVFAVTYDRRTVYLDDVEDNTNNKVLTGLRFREVRNALRLDIELTEFDFKTGKLGHSSWVFKEELEEQRPRLILDGSDDPIRNYEDNIRVNSVSGQQVAFRPSDVQKDLGQVTIPFLDVQEVVSNPPVALAGAGIFHKANSGSGGFLALKLKQYDFSTRV